MFSSSCLLLSTQEVQQIVVRQRCTVHTAVRSVRVDRCHSPPPSQPPLSCSSSNSYAKCYIRFEPVCLHICRRRWDTAEG